MYQMKILFTMIILLNITNYAQASSQLKENLISDDNPSKVFTVNTHQLDYMANEFSKTGQVNIKPYIMDRGVVSTNSLPFDDDKHRTAPAEVRSAAEKVIEIITTIESEKYFYAYRSPESLPFPCTRAVFCGDYSGFEQEDTLGCVCTQRVMPCFYVLGLLHDLLTFCDRKTACSKQLQPRKLRPDETFLEHKEPNTTKIIFLKHEPNTSKIMVLKDGVGSSWRKLLDVLNVHVASPVNYVGDIKFTFEFEVWTDGYARRIEDLEPMIMGWVNDRGGWKEQSINLLLNIIER